jgi:transcriptional regulator with XRE-family HTH domain
VTARAREFVRLMEVLGWSQSETARQLFITAPYVNEICNGKAEPSAALLQLFKLTAHAAGAPSGAPSGAAPTMLKDEEIIPYRAKEILPTWTREMIALMSDMEDADRRKVLQALKLLASLGEKPPKAKNGP